MNIFVPNRKLWIPDNTIADSLASPPAISRMIAYNTRKRICSLTPHRVMMGAGAGVTLFDSHTKAISFNGSDENLDYSTEEGIGIANIWTIGLWVKPANVTGDGKQLMNIATTDTVNSIQIIRNFAELQFVLNDSAGTLFKNWLTTNTYFASGTKIYLGFTWDGTTLKIYKNGVIVDAADINESTDIAGTMTDSNRGVTMGVGKGLSSAFFEGEISKGSLWSADLPATSLLALHDSGNGYQHDNRAVLGNYTETPSLKHQWALGNDSADIGADYIAIGGKKDMMENQSNIASADIVTF